MKRALSPVNKDNLISEFDEICLCYGLQKLEHFQEILHIPRHLRCHRMRKIILWSVRWKRKYKQICFNQILNSFELPLVGDRQGSTSLTIFLRNSNPLKLCWNSNCWPSHCNKCLFISHTWEHTSSCRVMRKILQRSHNSILDEIKATFLLNLNCHKNTWPCYTYEPIHGWQETHPTFRGHCSEADIRDTLFN